ncbi:hypothetical protein N0V83_006742 [Neocucurbitaria cava]|uniref:Uncharacterized protein n=1 Tax=Neocucurbitaria cava TaxID=798079 RepID=A0A9W9CKJ8_9PLEO|nr:hypothetical protein N0V83_006742 [Neocucurbitaria cava]
MSSLKEFFSRGDKDKLSPELTRALELLELPDIDALKKRFFSTDAFLKPWAVFRDSVLLLDPNSMPCATVIHSSEVTGGITRLEILWFYNQFDAGSLRYDPRADRNTFDYTPDRTIHGVIDKSKWGVREHEKLLYAGLLQEFKVGKRINPLGFEYFELLHICTAWEEVFVPIINVIRASYNVKGRRHYRRLALFIEDLRPSRLAFPEGNVGMPEGGPISPTPFRVLSAPRKTISSEEPTPDKSGSSGGVLTKKDYDETEKELRVTYPQYGGLVERPKFRFNMDVWLADQRIRAGRRKVVQGHQEANESSRLPEGHPSPSTPKRRASLQVSRSPIKWFNHSTRRSSSLSTSKKLSEEEKSPLLGEARDLYNKDDAAPGSLSPEQGSPHVSKSPMKRFSNRLSRSFSLSTPKKVYKDEPESLPQGRLYNTEDAAYGSLSLDQKRIKEAKEQNVSSPASSDTVIRRPRHRALNEHREASEESLYTSIRNTNPFNEDTPGKGKAPQLRAEPGDPGYMPMGQRGVTQAVITAEEVRAIRARNRQGPPKPLPYVPALHAMPGDPHPEVPPRHIPWPGFESDDEGC